jgi:hypothetical protein
VADLPCAGDVVTIHLSTRRFVCRVQWCDRKIFTERMALVAPFARKTRRLWAQLQRHGFALGGEPRITSRPGVGNAREPRTLLRLVRAAVLPPLNPVVALGIDDWSQRKGHVFGTILVDLEAHRIIDLLPDRTADSVAGWLVSKWLELLLKIEPTLRRIGYLYNPDNPGHVSNLEHFNTSAAALGVQVVPAENRSLADLDGAFERVVASGAEAFIASGYGNLEGTARLAGLAMSHHLVSLAWGGAEASLEVRDRAGAQGRSFGQRFLRETGLEPVTPQQITKRRRLCHPSLPCPRHVRAAAYQRPSRVTISTQKFQPLCE